MIFDKQKFKENAPPNIKRFIHENHLDVLNGMEVIFNSDDKYGIIKHYEVPEDNRADGFMLYPVDKGWCSDKGQMELF